jgi:hypothetical protein
MRRFATLWPEWEKVPSVMAQIAWTSHRVLMDRFSEDPDLYVWYAAKTVANRWPVRQLQAQIQLRLHERQGASVSNFAEVLDPPDAQTVLEATKDPYVFDFLELAEDARERQLELNRSGNVGGGFDRRSACTWNVSSQVDAAMIVSTCCWRCCARCVACAP